MKFDRMVQLVRHPVATIRSNCHRWGCSVAGQSQNLRCWGEWWQRAKEEAGAANVLMLRYEDLCTNTSAKVHDVLQFLGGSFASISLSSVRATLAERSDLNCIHSKSELHSQSTVANHADQIVLDDNVDLMSLWGYRTDGTSEWAPLNVESDNALDLAQTPRYLTSATNRGASEEQRNPWSDVW